MDEQIQNQTDPNRQDATAQPGQADPQSLRYGSAQPGEPVLLTPAQKAAQGPTTEPKTVQMDVLRDGSFGGDYYHAGETVPVPEDLVDTLTLAGFAARADRVERAQTARDAEQRRVQVDRDAAAKRRGGRAIAPMGTRAEPPKQE